MVAKKIRFRTFLTSKKGKTIISLVASLVIIAAMATVFAVANIAKQVTILDGAKSYTVSTNSDKPEEIIKSEGITLGKNDVLDASQFDKENPVLIIKREMTVTFSNSSESWNVTLKARTVNDVLTFLGINLGEGDVVVPSKFSVVSDGDKVTYFKAGTATLSADGMNLTVKTSNKTVGELLAEKNIVLKQGDTVTPSADKIAKNGDKIVVLRYSSKTVTKTETIAFKTIVKNDSSLAAGQTKVEQSGKNGSQEVTYKIEYLGSKETSKKVTEKKVIKKATDKIVIKGTKSGGTVSVSAGALNYSRKYTGTASAYYEAPGSMTASGLTVGVGRVGVDPSIIPYGTRLYITGYGYAVAADTGYGVTGMGRLVDLYMSSEAACNQWGLRTVTVYVLK